MVDLNGEFYEVVQDAHAFGYTRVEGQQRADEHQILLKKGDVLEGDTIVVHNPPQVIIVALKHPEYEWVEINDRYLVHRKDLSESKGA